jgi:hypothetical protein
MRNHSLSGAILPTDPCKDAGCIPFSNESILIMIRIVGKGPIHALWFSPLDGVSQMSSATASVVHLPADTAGAAHMATFRFFFNGRLLNDGVNENLTEVGIVHGSMVDCVFSQVGGVFANAESKLRQLSSITRRSKAQLESCCGTLLRLRDTVVTIRRDCLDQKGENRLWRRLTNDVRPSRSVTNCHDWPNNISIEETRASEDLSQRLKAHDNFEDIKCTNFMTEVDDIPAFTEQDDDEEVARDFFYKIKTNDSDTVSITQLHCAEPRCLNTGRFAAVRPCRRCSNDVLQSINELLQKHVSSWSDGVNFQQFFQAFEAIPRVRGERIRWAGGLKLDHHLGRFLKKGTAFDGLRGLRELTSREAESHILEVTSNFASLLPKILRRSIAELKCNEETDARSFINRKFCMSDSCEGRFASLQDFHNGPEMFIGSPNPDVELGMMREHCDKENADEFFESTNYGIVTCPRDEWNFVVCPEKGKTYPHTPRNKFEWNIPDGQHWKGDFGRDLVPLKEFSSREVVKQAKLEEIEVAGLRLYTGPMFTLYNAVLRDFPKQMVSLLKGNKYETTLFCITSGVLKLSKTTKIPLDRRLWRGLGGMILPSQFWEVKDGFRGAVELGFMSTTCKREVAMQYSGAAVQRGIVFEIQVGRIDIGADVSSLSQYPSEEEFLFPPLSCLEVAGEPRVEAGIVIFPLRVNVCLKGMTLEQLVERRKILYMAMAKNLREELSCYFARQDATCEQIVSEFFEVTDLDHNGCITEDEVTAALSSSINTDQLAGSWLLNIISSHDASEDSAQSGGWKATITLEKLKEMWNKGLQVSVRNAQNYFDAFLSQNSELPPEKFNDDYFYKEKVVQAIELKMNLQAQVSMELMLRLGSDSQLVSATLDAFYLGPEKLIGSPYPKLEAGIEKEHCYRSNAMIKFVSPNYGIETWPRLEYDFVVNPELSLPGHPSKYPHTPRERQKWSSPVSKNWKGSFGRDVVRLEDFLSCSECGASKLVRAEVISLRLMSGPMFFIYNCVLRRFPLETYKQLDGNSYETTIFCLISAIMKISRSTSVPEGKLYRGLGGMVLPESFFSQGNTGSFAGAVEFGFMSASASKETAVRYSGKEGRKGTVLEIYVGTIDAGASIKSFSQYPEEIEYLYPPLSCLEVTGSSRVEKLKDHEEVVFVPVRVNMCLKGLTVEQFLGRRKELHLSLVYSLLEEFNLALIALSQESQVKV